MAVGHLNGVREVSADVQDRTMSVRYESSDVTIESIQQALLQIGYESTIVP